METNNNNNILDMVPLHENHVTAVAVRGTWVKQPPSEMPCDNWVFPMDVTIQLHEVTEVLHADAEIYPYICVFGFKTLFGIN